MSEDENLPALSCPVCFENYSSNGSGSHAPRVLFCGHTICSVCVHDMMANRLNQCPICKDSCVLFRNTKINYALCNVVGEMENRPKEERKPTKKCNECKKLCAKDILLLCSTCNHNYDESQAFCVVCAFENHHGHSYDSLDKIGPRLCVYCRKVVSAKKGKLRTYEEFCVMSDDKTTLQNVWNVMNLNGTTSFFCCNEHISRMNLRKKLLPPRPPPPRCKPPPPPAFSNVNGTLVITSIEVKEKSLLSRFFTRLRGKQRDEPLAASLSTWTSDH